MLSKAYMGRSEECRWSRNSANNDICFVFVLYTRFRSRCRRKMIICTEYLAHVSCRCAFHRTRCCSMMYTYFFPCHHLPVSGGRDCRRRLSYMVNHRSPAPPSCVPLQISLRQEHISLRPFAKASDTNESGVQHTECHSS